MPSASASLRNRLTFRVADPETRTIFYVALITPIGRIRLAATERGLVRIELPSREAEAHMNVWLALHFPEASRRQGVNPILRKAASQVEAYFTGRLTAFSLAVEPAGTQFQIGVWQRVAEIPFGATASYQDVARDLGNVNAVRAVGAAQAANPLPIVVPCHRVIGAGGDLTGYAGGLAAKRWLLEHEQQRLREPHRQQRQTRGLTAVIHSPGRAARPFTLRRPTPES